MTSPQETAQAQPRKIWVVNIVTALGNLEDKLNELAADGRQVYSLGHLGSGDCVVVAFDPVLLASRQGASFAQGIMANMQGQFDGIFSHLGKPTTP